MCHGFEETSLEFPHYAHVLEQNLVTSQNFVLGVPPVIFFGAKLDRDTHVIIPVGGDTLGETHLAIHAGGVPPALKPRGQGDDRRAD